MIKSNKTKFFINILVLFSINLYIVANIFCDLNLMLISILVVFTCIFCFGIIEIKKSIVLLGFLVTFFTFLLGEYTIRFLFEKQWYNEFNNEAYIVTLNSLILSLVSLYIGFVFFGKNKNEIIVSKNSNKYGDRDKLITISKKFFYMTIVFRFIVVLEPAIFVQENSYLDLYTTYISSLPYFVHKLSQANEFIFCVILALLPSKRQIKYINIFYISCSAITILSGVRGTIVKVLLLVGMYYCFRHFYDKNKINGEKWITKSLLFMVCTLTPILIVFLSLYNSLRNGIMPNYNSFIDELLNFFETQGGSINVIRYSYEYKDFLPQTNISYTFGPLISMFKFGFFTQLFSNAEILKNNTIQMALYGNNLGASLTYLVMPELYVSGIGLGTQYIAEVYVDFGYWGVVIYNVLLGVILRRANFIFSNKWFMNAMAINSIFGVLGLSRNFTLSIIMPWFSVFNWLILLCIYICSKTSCDKNVHKKLID